MPGREMAGAARSETSLTLRLMFPNAEIDTRETLQLVFLRHAMERKLGVARRISGSTGLAACWFSTVCRDTTGSSVASAKMLPVSWRQVQAGSLRSPEETCAVLVIPFS